MVSTHATDASEGKTVRSKIEDRELSKKELENAILLAAHDLVEQFHNGKVLNIAHAKSYFATRIDARSRTISVSRPDLKSYREAMKMNWNEFTSYVISAARYICYNAGGDSGGVSGIARKMYYAGIAGVSQCTGQYHDKKPAYKYFNDIYLHEIYVGAVNAAVHRMVANCDNRLAVDCNKTAHLLAAHSKAKSAFAASHTGGMKRNKAKPETRKKMDTTVPEPTVRVSSPTPVPTIVHGPKPPMVSAPAR